MSRISRFSRPFALTPAVLLVAGLAGAHAQSNTGALRGEVKDATGAKVKGATVTLTNLGTKITRTEVTNGAGIYQFSAIDPGDYKVVVSGQGFKNYEVDTTTVTLAATTTVDAMLQVGGSGETVEVTAVEPLLDTASASGGQLFDKQQIQDLPNLGRNPFIFEKLDSNVTTMGDPRYVRAEDQTGLSQVSVSGAPIGANNYVVDGMPISRSDGGVTFIPSPEAVSDSKVQANAYDAEVGRTGGAVFNTSLTSGSAQYHGALYGITRQTPWAANVWFNPTQAAVQPDTTYQYAGGIGGPLFPVIGKKIKPLDNTFFYITEEGYRQAQFYPSSSAVTRVPTQAERNGDFTADGITIYDPTAPLVAGVRTALVPGSTPGQVIPASYISPTGKALLSAYPLPNTSGTGYNYNQLNSFKTRSDMYSGKVEHTFAPWWTAGVSFVHLATQEPSGFILGGVTVAENATKLLRNNNATAVNNTFTLNPTTLLTVGYGFQRYYSASFQYSNGYNLGAGGLAFPSNYTSQLQSDTFPSTTFSNVTNGRAIGGSNGTVQVQSSKSIVVGLTKTLNRHNIKVGYVYRLLEFKSTPNSVPSFTFNGEYTSQTPSAPPTASVLAFADALMGLPSASTYTLNSGSFNQEANYHAVYAQDDFRLNQKLTMNLGIRYEYELGQYEQSNRFNVGFSPTITSVIPSATPYAAHGGLLFAGQNGAPTHCCNQSHDKISPRFGLAYQVNPKMVIHGGFGLFYAPVGLAYVAQGYSQASAASINGVTPTGAVPVGAASYLSNPLSIYPSGFVQPSGNSLGALTGAGSSLGTLLDFARRYPLVQQYSVDIQQDLPFGIDFKLSYVGAHSRNIANTDNINQISAAQLATDRANGVKISSTTIPSPFYVAPGTTINGYAPTGVLTTKTISLAQSQLPFPQYTGVTLSQDNGYNRYNALAVKVQKRMTNGLTVLSTYTWSANWDNLWSAGSQSFATYGPQDVFNPKAEYARALNNVPNRFTAAFSYDLPIGRGKRFLGNSAWYVNELVGGWQINDEWVAQNGVPISIQQTNLNTANGTTGIGGSYQRPNLVGDAHAACGHGRPQGRLGITSYATGQTPYLNPAAFSAAPAYTYGNAPRNLPCQAPGSNSSDVSINKNFKITERVNAQFRAEALNAFNTPQFGPPAQTLVVGNPTTVSAQPALATGTNQTLGNVTTQINYSRIIQLGGRISF